MRSLKTTAPAAMRGLQPAVFVTCSHSAPSADDQTSLEALCPASRPLNQPPISHMRSLKTSVIGRSLCFHGASFVTSFQVLPSGELQTSRGGAAKELNQPPRIHSWSLKTTSPLESRACQPALSVTLTQSGAGAAPRANAANNRRADRTTADHFMVQVPGTQQGRSHWR